MPGLPSIIFGLDMDAGALVYPAVPFVPMWADEISTREFKTQWGWEGYTLYRSRLGDWDNVEDKVDDEFPLGTLLEGTDVFGRRINRTRVQQDPQSAAVLVVVEWFTFIQYSDT